LNTSPEQKLENNPDQKSHGKWIDQRALWLGLLCLAWCFALILGYYVFHKPLSTGMAAGLGLALWRLVIAFVLSSLAGGIGLRLEGFVKLHPLARFALQAGLGFGVLGLGVLLLGITIGLSLAVIGPLILLSLVLLRKSIAAWWQELSVLHQVWIGCNGFCRFSLVYLAAVLTLGLITSLAPPLGFDALVYHLAMPQAYLQAGRISGLPWLMYSGMPQQSEMLYTLAAAFGGVQAATVTGCVLAAIALVGMLGFGLQSLSLSGAIVGAAMLVSGYSLAVLLGASYDEWPALLFGLGFLVCLDDWMQNRRLRTLVLAGAFAGFALGARYTAGILLICGFGVIIWGALRTKENPVPSLFTLGLTATAVSMPWWIKNLVYTGNPFYPLLFPSGEMTAARLAVFQHSLPWGDWTDVLLLPFKATLTGVEGAPGYAFSAGPLLLALAGLAWLGYRSRTDSARKTIGMACVASVLGLLIWIVGNRFSGFLVQTRMYTPLFPAFGLLAGAGWEGLAALQTPGIRFGRIFTALCCLVLVLNLIEVGALKIQQDPLKAVAGMETDSQYLDRNLGWYAPAMRAVSALPAGSKTLLLYEPRSLYCLPVCLPDETMDAWQRSLNSAGGNSQLVIADWKGKGFTHVLYYQTGAEFMRDTQDPHHTAQEWSALAAFLKTLPAPVEFGNVYDLYRLP
jgi:hypothetical protein